MDYQSLPSSTWRSRLRMEGPQKEQARESNSLANAAAGLSNK